MAVTADSIERGRVYSRLVWRNRVVGVLRLLVPVSGALALGGLAIALYLNSIGAEFSVGRVSLDRNMLVVAEPRYAGVLDNGSTYQVSAATARAAVNDLNRVDVTGGAAVMLKPDGSKIEGRADTATLDNASQVVTVTGRADVSDSTGLVGWLEKAVVDYPNERITTTGPVEFSLPDGSKIEGATMDFDQTKRRWVFTGVTITLPATPGELF